MKKPTRFNLGKDTKWYTFEGVSIETNHNEDGSTTFKALKSTKNKEKEKEKQEMTLREKLQSLIFGQDQAINEIVPFVEMHKARLNPEGRPLGIFLLLGPTGTGKTHTVEALADALHGHPRHLLQINCGEFQMEHEVARLIGAPPGYLGHRETNPLLTQQKINSVTSVGSDISIVLFDEIEKAAPSIQKILLSIFDKSILQLGDNTRVNFDNCLIFLTSNLGANKMQAALNCGTGFAAALEPPEVSREKMERIAHSALKRHFSPEFMNRIDRIITYDVLGVSEVELIVDREIEEMRKTLNRKLSQLFVVDVKPAAHKYLVSNGLNREYGAREIRRLFQRKVWHPLAALVVAGKIVKGSTVIVDCINDDIKVNVKPTAKAATAD